MKKYLWVLTVLLAVLCCASSRAQVHGPTFWKRDTPAFTTGQELAALARQHKDDSRRSYYLILRAHSQGQAMTERAVMIYRELHREDLRNTTTAASFAFAHYMATKDIAERWPRPSAAMRPFEAQVIMLLRDVPGRAPRDATIQMMAGRAHYFLNMMPMEQTQPEVERAFSWMRRAIELEPNWAEPYFWIAKMYMIHGVNHPTDRSDQRRHEMNARAVGPLKKALELGGQWTRLGCWGALALVLSETQRQEALRYLDLYIAAVGPRPSDHWSHRTRARLVAQLRQRGIAVR